jgi:NAD+ diphosphatase
MVVAAGEDGVVLDGDESLQLARRPVELAGEREPMLLGLDDGAALFAVDLDGLDHRARSAFIAEGRLVTLRDAGSILPRSEGGLAAYLAALVNWHRKHGYCSNCGAKTLIAEAGYSCRCPVCGTVHFPRTDPVVIMLVESAGRLLLGRRAEFPAGWYSILAGFVSPGESLEEAVVREVREESTIEVYDP